MKKHVLIATLIILLFVSSGVSLAQVRDSSAQWAWMSGDTIALNTNGTYSSTGLYGVYGTKGTPAPANRPGGRSAPITWRALDGTLWLFGGQGMAGAPPTSGLSNDLWKYDPAADLWTWMSGTDSSDRNGKYGPKGTAGTNYWPGGRNAAVAWVDQSGNFWLFGGYGLGATTTTKDYLNDLWKYNPATNEWTWVGGISEVKQAGTYGSKGAAGTSYIPGGRSGAVGCTDQAGNFWLFGGTGRTTSASVTAGAINELWKYNPVTGEWTWVAGSQTLNGSGTVGSKGAASTSYIPGGRSSAVCWTDLSGNIWIFGGNGRGANSTSGYCNDLWKFNPANLEWSWESGNSTVVTAAGNYGSRGYMVASNVPGGRYGHNGWRDADGNLWIFGGYGYPNSTTAAYMNDVWKYDLSAKQWTYMKGAATGGVGATFGTKKIPAWGNNPAGSYTQNGWTDATGDFWLFEGRGHSDVSGYGAYFSILWKLAPAVTAPGQPGNFLASKGSVCKGESVTYRISKVAGATSYNWTYTPAAGVTVTPVSDTSVTVTFSASAAGGTLSVVAVNGGGSSPARDIPVTVNDLPSVTVTPTGAQPVCDGDSLQLSATATGVTYQWKNGTTNIGTGAGSYYAKTNGDYTVTVTGTATGCSAVSAITAVTVNPLPAVTVAPAGSSLSVCDGDSLRLSATATGVTYQWKNGTTNIGTGASSYYAKANGNYTVTVTGTTTNCSVTSAVKEVTVNPQPVAASTNTGTQSICQGDSLLLSATPASGMSYEWRLGTVTVGTNADYHASAAGSYTVKVTSTVTNCSAVSAPATDLYVNALPAATVNVTGSAIVCNGDSVVLTAGSGTGYNYQWKEGTTNVGTGSIIYGARTTGAYKVVVTDGATGCRDSTLPVSVMVHERPVVALMPGDTAFCEGGIVTLSVSTQDTGLDYRWKNGQMTILLATAYFLEINKTGVYTVVAGRTQVAGCEDSTNAVTVTVHPAPVVNITWDDVLFHATPGYVSYQWNTGTQPLLGATDSSFRPSANGGYSVTVTDSNGCTNTSPAYNVTNVGVTVRNTASTNMQVNVYPNPSDGLVYISSPGPVHITLTGMDGKLLLHERDARVIDMRSCADGIYMMCITDSQGAFIGNRKIVKKNW